MVKSEIELLTSSNPVFKAYIFWSAVLILKMLLMSPLTGIQRFRTQTFANPEDLLIRKSKVKFDDPHVERVRRAHRNDLENIIPFFIIGLFYVMTNPPAFFAINLFRVVAMSRIIHTIVYAVYVIPQPARVLAFVGAMAGNFLMALHVIKTYA